MVTYRGTKAQRAEIVRDFIVPRKFNVVLTTYEFALKDNELLAVDWQYVVIDEGHRIKNKNAKLSQKLREYKSRNRLLLTGTPLQNDLEELWSLLNYLLPTIFNSSANFQEWFNDPLAGPATGKGDAPIAVSEEESMLIINRLHSVLRPFLLRRKKAEVLTQLPDKKEEVLHCKMSAMQKLMYRNMAESQKVVLDPSSKRFVSAL